MPFLGVDIMLVKSPFGTIKQVKITKDCNTKYYTASVSTIFEHYEETSSSASSAEAALSRKLWKNG